MAGCPGAYGPAAAGLPQAYDAKRAAKDAEREAQEAAQEEEIRRAAEERQRREEAEAAKWMHLFTVEAAGEDALSVEQGEVCCGAGRGAAAQGWAGQGWAAWRSLWVQALCGALPAPRLQLSAGREEAALRLGLPL